MDAALDQLQDIGRLAARAASRMAGSIADSSAFGTKVGKRAAPHSGEQHSVRDLLFPRQANSTGTMFFQPLIRSNVSRDLY